MMHLPAPSMRRAQRGLTLIEITIALLVAALILGVASSAFAANILTSGGKLVITGGKVTTTTGGAPPAGNNVTTPNGTLVTTPNGTQVVAP